MIAIGSRSHAERTRRDRVYRDGSIWKKSEWMLGDRDQALSPTVFLIEQPADRTLTITPSRCSWAGRLSAR